MMHLPRLSPLFARLCVMICLLVTAVAAHAGSSPAYVSDRITARLITAENGVAPEAKSISAAIEVTLAEGWKTYWRAPGAVGYPMELDWSGSVNLSDHELLWPAPKRFSAFEIENYGYESAVTFPLRLALDTPGDDLILKTDINMLVCAEICVPELFTLSMVLPKGTQIDRHAGALIAEAAARVPLASDLSDIAVTSAALQSERSVLEVVVESDTPFRDPSVIPDMGLDASFGPPDIAITNGGKTAHVRFDVLATPETLPLLQLVVTDGARAARFAPELGDQISAPPASNGLAWFFLLAFIGGVILNVMPCVLPVLTIKFASALKARDQSPGRVRAGFLMSALGVLSFMWALALVLLAIRAGGGSIGWGIQFQNPYFLTAMVTIVTLFAANLFGLFEINLPQSWNTKMAGNGASKGLGGDFWTGALAAVLATPCSAPFLGTSITFALAGSAMQVLVIFTALGLGLALPYLLVALWPQAVRALPKPGAWMNKVRIVMGLLLLGTAVWLLSVILGVTGGAATALIALLLLGMLAVLAFSSKARPLAIAGLAAAALIVPMVTTAPAPTAMAANSDWVAFAPEQIAAEVNSGQVVFVDITADWCLTCKANKSLVLDRDAIVEALGAEDVTPMIGDWTRPDETILSYLKEHGRYGIPFNIVYGPGAPDGIALPELLSKESVLDALAKARG